MKVNFKNINWRRIFLNKFFIATIIFAAIILFFDSDNLFRIRKMNKQTKSLKKEIKRLEKEYADDSVFLDKMRKDAEFRERYARETYQMKNENEEVYLIEKQD
ncbi:MAG: septum formation initiator family protein [Bacteroidales bacterium]|jgi:cell division protein FtsB|nr:septum formation initiator family protein [Bacteroidales bacterium]